MEHGPGIPICRQSGAHDISDKDFLIALALATLLIGACCLGWYVWRLWHTSSLVSTFFSRWYPALAELDEFFELMDRNDESSHFYGRHSPVLSIEEIWQRAQTGDIPFSGMSGRPVSSARWLRHRDLLRAVDSALWHWQSGRRPKHGGFAFRFEHPIGEGYRKGDSTLLTTDSALVVIRRGNIITAFPVLDTNASANEHSELLQHECTEDLIRRD